MKIIATQDFLDGRFRYVKDSKYDVPDRRGGGYTTNGWATERPDDEVGDFITVTLDEISPEAPSRQSDLPLEVQNITHAPTLE